MSGAPTEFAIDKNANREHNSKPRHGLSFLPLEARNAGHVFFTLRSCMFNVDGITNLSGRLLRLLVIEVSLVLIISASSLSQTFSVLHTFTGDDGSSPYSGVTVDRAGNLYGTTRFGGTRAASTWVVALCSSYRHKARGGRSCRFTASPAPPTASTRSLAWSSGPTAGSMARP